MAPKIIKLKMRLTVPTTSLRVFYALCCAVRDVFCAGRVVEEDLVRTMKACGGAIQTSVNGLSDGVLGVCELFEEEQIGGER